jgi:hypothetical protein
MKDSLKLTALPREKFILLLKQAGARTISEETLSADVEAGAPQNTDGTFNLIQYAAWLAKQMGGAND